VIGSGVWTRVARQLVRWYPRAWRERYEEEFVALLDETHGHSRVVTDLAVAAVEERARRFMTRTLGELGATLVRKIGTLLGQLLLAWCVAWVVTRGLRFLDYTIPWQLLRGDFVPPYFNSPTWLWRNLAPGSIGEFWLLGALGYYALVNSVPLIVIAKLMRADKANEYTATMLFVLVFAFWGHLFDMWYGAAGLTAGGFVLARAWFRRPTSAVVPAISSAVAP
jgi:hypothetical protein